MTQFGTTLSPGHAWGQVLGTSKYAQQLEDWGYDYLWCSDERFERDVYVVLSQAATATKTTMLGTCVTNPYLRHPLMTATSIGTVNELSNGRAVLGIGAGASAMFERQGIKRPFPPLLAIREAIEVMRPLLNGKAVDYNGRTMSLKGADLDFESRTVPIYIASRGPRLFELAGELADGVIIGSLASREGLRFAFEHIKKGAERSGRDPKEIEVVFWAYTSISDDEKKARQLVRKIVVSSMWSSQSILKHIGIGDDVWRPIEETLRRGFAAGLEPGGVYEQAYSQLSDEILDAWSITGNLDKVAGKVKDIIDAGVDQFALLPFAETENEKKTMQKQFAETVIPRFR